MPATQFVIIILALLGLTKHLLIRSPTRTVGLWFYSVELLFELALFWVSFTAWFRRVWEAVVLGSAFLLLAVMAVAAVMSRDYVAVTFGLLLMQMGAAAFMPWSPSYQFGFNLGTLGCIGAFTLLAPQWDPMLVSLWIVLITGAIIGQVACSSSYRYRLELGRRLDTVIAGRERVAAGREQLAAEVREREKVIAQLRETQQDLMISREAALSASRARSEFLSSMSHEIRAYELRVGDGRTAGNKLDAEQERYLQLINQRRNPARLINSSSTLFEWNPAGSLAPGEFDLEMLEQLLMCSQSRLSKNTRAGRTLAPTFHGA